MEYLTHRPDWDGKKILLVRLDRLGDLIVSTSAMQAIRKTFPQSQIDLLGSSLNCALFSCCDYLDNTYCYDKKRLFASLKLLFTLRAQKYDVVICLTPQSRSSNFFVKNLGAPIKLALCVPPTKFQKIYTLSAKQSPKSHIMEFLQENMKEMGFEVPTLKPIISIPQSSFDTVNAAYPKDPEKMRIIFSIGNIKRPHKRWGIEKYAEVVKALYKKYNSEIKELELIIMTGKSDLPLLDEFTHTPKDYYKLYIGTSIAESAALIENSDLFICTSSGPSHIAASTSCPILSIITSYMYDVWRPLRENDVCVVNDNLENIEVKEVLESIETYIDKWKKTQNLV